MKHLRLFKTEAERSTYKGSSDFILPNVNYVVESDSVDFNSYVEPKVPQKAGDIVYYKDGSLKTVKYTDWKTDLGTPVGVITIPEGFAPDGKARMVALSGQTTKKWCPSSAQTDTSLTNYTKVPTTDNAGSTSTGSNVNGYLPSDKFTGATSYVDSVAKYFQYFQTSNMIPSPYAGDAPNPEYYKEISGNNALSDFNGLTNTKTLVELDSAKYQAANHCWTYNDGVSTTQWYLPACGELGYMMPRFNEIQAGLAAVSAAQLGSLNSYWSSSESSSNDAYDVYTGNGLVGNYSKNSSDYARPWAVVV
jgi:hypothetical protein